MAERFDPVLVTGATGFVGAGAVHALVARGHEVHLLLRGTRNQATAAWRLTDVSRQVTSHAADLTDADAVFAVVAAVRPRIVLHFAAYGAYEHQADARRIFETNVIGTCNLFEACRRCNVQLVVNAGSSSEYGFQSAPMKESGRLAPNSYYAVAKAAQTHLASLIAQRDGLAALTFRLFSVYGPWEEPTRLIPTLLRRAWNGLPLEMASPATARDFVYLDDVLALLLDFPRLAQATPGGVYNVGSGKQTMLADLVPLVCTVTRATPEVRWRSMAARHWDTTTWCAEPGLTHRTFGWSPQHSLVDGLAATLAWLEHRGDLSHARLPCRNVA